MTGNFGGWLFQCNPRKFRLFRAVEQGVPLDNWAVNQHRDEIAVGDRAALWISAGEPGYLAGVYGIGTVRSLRWRGRVDKRFWVASEAGPDEYVDLDFDRWIFHHPISVDELKRDPDFDDALILRMPRATTSRCRPTTGTRSSGASSGGDQPSGRRSSATSEASNRDDRRSRPGL